MRIFATFTDKDTGRTIDVHRSHNKRQTVERQITLLAGDAAAQLRTTNIKFKGHKLIEGDVVITSAAHYNAVAK